jgi:hypothetical protein
VSAGLSASAIADAVIEARMTSAEARAFRLLVVMLGPVTLRPFEPFTEGDGGRPHGPQ